MPESANTPERLKMCFDRVLPRNLHRPNQTMRRKGTLRAVNPLGTKWMNGSTLRVKFMDGSRAEHHTAREQARWWEKVANLKFDFNNANDAEIRIAFDHLDGAWSTIGTESRDITNDQPTMNLGFLDGGTAAHEFGHGIGLGHEHSNPAAGIQWDEGAVIREYAGSPNFWTPDETRLNVLHKYEAAQINGTAFDPDSIMLYFFPPELTLNGIGTKANEILSLVDKQFISGAKMYPRTGTSPNAAKELKVNSNQRTKASIRKAGEEDLFKFTAKSDGRYLIDTLGPTDMVMKLFGPDSPTSLIAEDDDSGFNTNVKIGAPLIPGVYFIQVRHYNPKSKTGNYSIRVRKE